MALTDYQKHIMVWLYGLQNYQGIFANVPPPPPGIVPPAISQAPDGEAWIARDTMATQPVALLEAIPKIPGTAQNDPQVAISAMPDLVEQVGGALFLTLRGVKSVEIWADLPQWPSLAEEVAANIRTRRDILESATSRAAEYAAREATREADLPRWATSVALLSREGLIAQDAGSWILTEDGWSALQGARDMLLAVRC